MAAIRSKRETDGPRTPATTGEFPAGAPCPLCRRPLIPGPSVNLHHLLPRTYGGRETVAMHRICHDKIHAVLRDAELRDHFHTVERLRSHPEIAAFVRWVARKPPEFVDGHAGGRGRRR